MTEITPPTGHDTTDQATGRNRSHTHEPITDADSNSPHGTEPAVPVQAVEVVTARLLADHNAGYDAGTERESYDPVPLWMERKAGMLVAALSSAGFLATEQEWGVRRSSRSAVSVVFDDDAARRRAKASGGAVVSRRVTAWTEVAS